MFWWSPEDARTTVPSGESKSPKCFYSILQNMAQRLLCLLPPLRCPGNMSTFRLEWAKLWAHMGNCLGGQLGSGVPWLKPSPGRTALGYSKTALTDGRPHSGGLNLRDPAYGLAIFPNSLSSYELYHHLFSPKPSGICSPNGGKLEGESLLFPCFCQATLPGTGMFFLL